MSSGGEIGEEIGGTIDRLQGQLDNAQNRATELHRTGADEEAVLAETAVAVGAAKALEVLTGESVEAQLERGEDGPPAAPPAPAGPQRWFRRDRSSPE